MEPHVELENSEKAPESKRKLVPSIFDSFSKLTKDQEKIRVNGSVQLIKLLVENDANENGDNEVNYALGRLIRGVGSSKPATRSGFYSTLVAFFNFTEITVETIFEHIAKQLHKGGSNSKSENADICTGQVLVCGAILRSNLFAKSTEDEQKKVLEMLINAGKERTYLVLATYYFIIDLYETLTAKEFQKLVLPIILPEITKGLSEQNLDSLFLLLKTKEKYPSVLNEKFFKKHFGNKSIICEENLKELASIITTIPRITSLNHPIYNVFASELIKTDLTEQFASQLDFLLQRSNRIKILIITNFISKILKAKTTEELKIHALLGNNWITQVLNMFRQFKGKERDHEFKKLVEELFEVIVSTIKIEEKQEPKISLLKKLLFHPGTFIFEKVTRSKLVQQITLTLNVEGVKLLGTVYEEVILLKNETFKSDSSSENWQNNKDRLYASHLLAKLLTLPVMSTENDWKCEKLIFLMNLGLFKNESGNVGNELAASLKETFYHSLDVKLSKLEDYAIVLSKVFHQINKEINESNLEEKLRSPITLEQFEIWQKTVATVTKIEGKKIKRIRLVFLILFLQMGLQIFNDVNLACESLKELFLCFERVKKDKKQGAIDGAKTENDPEWIEVTIDLFLNLLSHNSGLLRKVINCVFPHLCKYLNSSSIYQILSVLDPKNDQNPLSHESSDSDSNCDTDETNDSETEPENSESDASDNETTNDKLKLALQKVLMSENVQSDAESVDLDLISDTEGEKLNSALSEVFKMYKPNKGNPKKQTKDQETLTHFRSRALDLIEVYLDSEPSMVLTLEIMLPLLQTLEFSIRDDHQKPLQERVKGCLKKLASVKKFSDTLDLTDEILTTLLTSLLEKGTKNQIIIQFMGEQISDCCVFVIKCSQILGANVETPKKVRKHLKNRIVDVIKNCLVSFFTKRDSLIPFVLFKHVLQLNYEGNLGLVPFLNEYVFNENERVFRKTQALELLRLFYSNHRLLKSCSESNKLSEQVVALKNEVLTSSVDFFTNAHVNIEKTKIRDRFLVNLFQLLVLVKNSPINVDFDYKNLGNLVRNFRSYVTFSNDTKKTYNKLCSIFGVPNKVQMQKTTIKLNNQALPEEIEPTNDNNSKKKKKMTKDKQKLKKEARELRLKSLSDGLKIEFSTQNVSEMETQENTDVESDSDAESEPKRKRKSSETVVEVVKNKKKKKSKVET